MCKHHTFRLVLISASLWACAILVNAQTPAMHAWTLTECIMRAKEQSLDASESKLSLQSTKESLRSAWWALSPTLSAGASYELTFGRAIDYGSNTVSNDLQSLNFNISASLPLFTGLARFYEIKSSQLALKESEAMQLAMEQSITLRVAQAFLDLLYQQDLVTARRYQAQAMEQLVKLAQTRADAGLITAGEALDMQAQLASEKQALTEAQNGVLAANVALLQLMNYHEVDSIVIIAPSIDSAEIPPLPEYSTNALFEEATQSYPALQAATLSYQQAQQNIRVAQSGYMPSLSLNAGYGTGARQFLQKNQYLPSETYENQLKNNWSVYVGLALRVPIFDGLATRGRVQQAKINAMKRDIAAQRASQELYNIVQRAWADAQSAYRQYQAAAQSVKALRVTVNWAEKKRTAGAISSYDYTQTRSRLNVAETTLLQCRYSYIFKLMLLDLYRGKPITL